MSRVTIGYDTNDGTCSIYLDGHLVHCDCSTLELLQDGNFVNAVKDVIDIQYFEGDIPNDL
jgi:hypothetical protein